MAAEKADRAGLEPLRTSQTRKPHDTRLTIPESDGTASERRTDAEGRRTAPNHLKEGQGMKWNMREIMTRAWAIFRKAAVSFAEALHRAWQSVKAEPINAERIAAAQTAAGIIGECRTWADWKRQGLEVIHGSKAVFQAILIHASKGDGATYTASFFSRDQVQEVTA